VKDKNDVVVGMTGVVVGGSSNVHMKNMYVDASGKEMYFLYSTTSLASLWTEVLGAKQVAKIQSSREQTLILFFYRKGHWDTPIFTFTISPDDTLAPRYPQRVQLTDCSALPLPAICSPASFRY
jgi:hypothetical protein